MPWPEIEDSEPENCDMMDLQAIGRGREVACGYGVCNEVNSDVVRRDSRQVVYTVHVGMCRSGRRGAENNARLNET